VGEVEEIVKEVDVGKGDVCDDGLSGEEVREEEVREVCGELTDVGEVRETVD